LLGAWLIASVCIGEGALVGIGLFAGMSAFVFLYENGSAWAIAMLLPVVVLTNFANVELSNLPLLETPRAVYMLALCLVLGARLALQGRSLRIPTQARPFLAFIGILLLTVFFSQSPFKSLAFFVKTFFLVGILFLFSLEAFADPKGRRIFERTLVGLVALVILFGLYQFATQSLGFGEEWRSRNTLEELRAFQLLRVPSFFASTYVTSEFYFLLIPFFLVRSEGSVGWARFLWRGAIALLIFGVLLTQQRSGLAIVLFQVVAFKLLEGHGRIVKRLVQVVFVTVALGVGTVLILGQMGFEQGLLERMQATFAAGSVADIQDAGSTLARIERIHIAWLIFKDHVMTGVGLGLSPLVYPEYGWTWFQFNGGAHNVYLYLLSESGIIGLFGFLNCFQRYLQRATRGRRQAVGGKRRHWVGGLVFIATLLLDGIFSGLWSYPSLIFIALGLAYVYAQLPVRPLERER